jgi:hypothetical protein
MSTDMVDIFKDCKQNSSILKLRMKMLEEVVEAAITTTGFEADKREAYEKEVRKLIKR